MIGCPKTLRKHVVSDGTAGGSVDVVVTRSVMKLVTTFVKVSQRVTKRNWEQAVPVDVVRDVMMVVMTLTVICGTMGAVTVMRVVGGRVIAGVGRPGSPGKMDERTFEGTIEAGTTEGIVTGMVGARVDS